MTEPFDPHADMATHLATHGPGVYHMDWGVDNLPHGARDLAVTGITRWGTGGITESPRGYWTSSIDPASAHGVWLQLAEGEAADRRGRGWSTASPWRVAEGDTHWGVQLA